VFSPVRILLVGYMVWLLVVFLPGHTRGRVTMGPREKDLNLKLNTPTRHDCCSESGAPVRANHTTQNDPSYGKPAHGRPADDTPTQRDRANCAVCFWAAGLLPTEVFFIEFSLAERLQDAVAIVIEQWNDVIPIRESLGRGPPTRV
jgi:hypothetical protein